MNKNNNIKTNDLNGYTNKNPFETDSDYFEKLNNRIHNTIDNLEEIEKIAPTLCSIPKQNPFSVPVSYFENLPKTIQDKKHSTESTTSILDWLLLLIKPSFAVPVLSVCIIAIIGIKNINRIETIQSNNEDYSMYDELEHIDETIIVEELVQNSVSENENESDQITDYLLDNTIEELN